ncbi:hypothetical protein [Rhizobium leguminosarum]|uniref:VpaChn25_0724 family phage protein n=1 Tax=Rhizobium leguminosarum TaxID=384 RepID=UPI00140FB2A9|nr:hypothetical protein [Rhizobium leguminosarum]QIO60676.1 hypothetical protein HA463_24475 [Rhizobium leguminosarum bv. trifolii]
MNMAIDYARLRREDARLIILKEIAQQKNRTLSSGMMDPALEQFAIYEDRPWIHQQIDYLETMGAVTVVNAGTVKIVTITNAGMRHLKCQVFIEGIKEPSHPFGD